MLWPPSLLPCRRCCCCPFASWAPRRYPPPLETSLPPPLVQVLADIHEECSRHGTVLRVVVPRPPVPAEAPALVGNGQYGKAFIQFLDPSGAAKVGKGGRRQQRRGDTVGAVRLRYGKAGVVAAALGLRRQGRHSGAGGREPACCTRVVAHVAAPGTVAPAGGAPPAAGPCAAHSRRAAHSGRRTSAPRPGQASSRPSRPHHASPSPHPRSSPVPALAARPPCQARTAISAPTPSPRVPHPVHFPPSLWPPCQARDAISGRMFAGSTVEARTMQPSEFIEAIATQAPAGGQRD